MTWLPWVLLPGVGAVIGYATNWVAIKMLFRPRRRRLGLQGLLPRRQHDLASSVGRVVGEDLVDLDRLLAPFAAADLRPHFERLMDEVIERKVRDYRSLPILGTLLTADNLAGLRDTAVDELVAHQGELVEALKELAREHVDVGAVVEERIRAFELDTLETVVDRVARTEFRAIELWGALLGLLIGLVQAFLLYLVTPD